MKKVFTHIHHFFRRDAFSSPSPLHIEQGFQIKRSRNKFGMTAHRFGMTAFCHAELVSASQYTNELGMAAFCHAELVSLRQLCTASQYTKRVRDNIFKVRILNFSLLTPVLSLLTSLLLISCSDVSFTEVLKGKTLPVTAVRIESEPLHTGYSLDSEGNLFQLEGTKSKAVQTFSIEGLSSLAYTSDGFPHPTKNARLPSSSDISLSSGTIIIPVTIEGFSDQANDNTFAVHIFNQRGTINPFLIKVPFFEEQEMLFKALELEARLSTSLSDYEIARTETTFTLWKKVFDWAVENGYTFRAGCGVEGSEGKIGAPDTGSGQPVSNVSLRDVRVWLNALSEIDGLDAVYRDSKGNAVKDSTDGYSCDNATVDRTKNGWRLPTAAEYGFAARGGLASWYAKSSGMLPWTTFPSESEYDFPYPGAETEEMLAVYAVCNAYESKPCASRKKNTLGLYDFAGNMAEWSDEKSPDGKSLVLGGAFDESAENCRIDSCRDIDSSAFSSDVGFRIARTVSSID